MVRVVIEILAGGVTVKNALLSYDFKEEKIEFLRNWRGEELADLHTRLEEGDRLMVAVPLSGGSLH